MDQQRDGRKLRASQRRLQRRDQILIAARKVFSFKGYHACSVADILSEAGIARGTYYLYFRSKRAVFEVLLEEMFAQIRGALSRVKLGPDNEPALDQMYGNVRRIIDVLESNRELTIILLREAVGLDADFDQRLTTFYDRLSRVIEETLKLGQQMQLVRPCDTRLVSYCVLGSLKETVMHLLTSGQEVDRDLLTREILEYNLRGLFLK